MELTHRGNVRYGEPHLPDYWAGHRFGAQWFAPGTSGAWVAASLLPLIVHVDHRGTITGPFRLESPGEHHNEIHGLAVDEDDQVWVRWPGGISHYDPTSEQQRQIELGARQVVLGDGALWTVDYEGELIRIDRTTLEQTALGPVGRSIYGLQKSEGLIWIAIWDPELRRTIVVQADPDQGDIRGSIVVEGSARQLLAQPGGVVVRVWRAMDEYQRQFDDTLVWLSSDGEIKRELVVEPTGVSATVHDQEVWLSGHDPFDHGSFGQPSVIRRLGADGAEESFPLSGTIDQLTVGPTGVWGRLDERHAPRRAGSLVYLEFDGTVRTTDLSGVDIEDHLPPPPPSINAQEQEERARERIAKAMFGHGIATDPDSGARHGVPPIRGVTIEDVRLEGSFPQTEIVILFRADDRPGVLFGRRRRIWEDSGELSDVSTVMDVNLTEDIHACGHGLPSDPIVDSSGISWF